MRVELDVSPETAYLALRAVVADNIERIQRRRRQYGYANGEAQFPVLVGLSRGEIRYVNDLRDKKWLDYDALLRIRRGNCADLAPAVAAELICAGIPARPIAYLTKGTFGLGDGTFHVIVEYKDPATGLIRYGDPSVLGGML